MTPADYALVGLSMASLWLLPLVIARGVIAVIAVALLSGCAWSERTWHGCDANAWRGFEAEKTCAHLDRMRDMHRGL